ncbi:protein kinase domain-containing protein [Bacillus sp. 3255]|uniref:protein kinase domain-containing protein n=1 Tax=Bacillus sp. 3255 TaxID=2817904 RepID=UPI00285BE3A0|nr:LuxR C-terminal-related transcriptional regulator [Bacillus sp. 3255]MDR6878505.1 DNA-binding CsgD family transcriptional regulator [Bacillus sp. 3255]
MLTVTGYHIQQVIFEDPTIVVCHAFSEEHACEVLLKIVKEGHRAIIENAKLINEYEIAGSLQMPGIIKPIALLRQGNGLVLASEWVHGLTLRHFVKTAPLTVPVFLKLAVQIAKILEGLHKQHIVHMNIRPDTIVVVPSSLKVSLTGMGHSVLSMDGGRQARNMPLIEGSPPYMAPERTGQLNRVVTGSTDLYSLGVTFYEMLSGGLPFQARDPLEWAHAHLAKKPQPLSAGHPEIPAILEEIIMKLLEKTVERRYQSAFGLRADLESCLHMWEQSGAFSAFEIGWQDVPRLLEISGGDDSASGTAGHAAPVLQPNAAESGDASSGYAQVLELAAVMRASQAFSEERDSAHLLGKLMSIAVEVAGAQRGCFVAMRAAELYVEQAVDTDGGMESGTENRTESGMDNGSGSLGGGSKGSVPLSRYEGIFQNLVSYVAIKRQFVILDDASKVGLFTQDPYVVKHKPRSVLGLPIIAQGELQGVLYLENNYTTGVFAPERLGVLHMLASQINYVQRLIGYYGGTPNLQEPALGGVLTAPVQGLTEREIEVLQWMAAGLSNKEIAERLVMSAGTVKVHMRNLFAKLQVNNRVKAVAVATQLNLLQPVPQPNESGAQTGE